MAALRPSAVLLLSCVLLAGASYVRRLDVFSAGPLSESPAPSRLSCAAWCDRKTGCLGFTLTSDGSCQLFDSLLRSTADTSAAVPVSYTRPPITPCQPDWFSFRDRCYFRAKFDDPQSWEEHRSMCQSLVNNSDLAVPNDVQENSWLIYHPSRPSTAEFTGLRLENGKLIDLDDTTVSFQLLMYPGAVDPGYVNLRVSKVTGYNAWGSDKLIADYVCEAPNRCLFGTPCPADWLDLDDYCYHYVSTAQTWHDADQHCTGLQPGARLSPVINMEIYNVLHYSLSLPGPVWVGMSDAEVEGTWKSVDDSPSSFTWREADPDLGPEPNGETVENCMEMGITGANDLECSVAKTFICHLPADDCLN